MANKEVFEETKFPGIYMYHKDLGAVLFESQEEVDALNGAEWFDSPACGSPQTPEKKFVPVKPLDRMTKVELVQAGLSIDLKKEEITGLTKEELITLLK